MISSLTKDLKWRFFLYIMGCVVFWLLPTSIGVVFALGTFFNKLLLIFSLLGIISCLFLAVKDFYGTFLIKETKGKKIFFCVIVFYVLMRIVFGLFDDQVSEISLTFYDILHWFIKIISVLFYLVIPILWITLLVKPALFKSGKTGEAITSIETNALHWVNLKTRKKIFFLLVLGFMVFPLLFIFAQRGGADLVMLLFFTIPVGVVVLIIGLLGFYFSGKSNK